jgi:hypothetical protein
MKTVLSVFAALIILISSCRPSEEVKKTGGSTLTISKDALKDKIMGGWAGQTIAVTYGGPTEFKFQGTMIQDYQSIPWYDGYIKETYLERPGLYDDIYMDLTFVEVFEKLGLEAPVDSFASAYAHAGYRLWHANQAGRYNILNGIKPPLSGNWQNNPHADCIDFQIEADFAGLMAPGMTNSASEICDKIGHIMNYGDGWYGGVFVAAMYTIAFYSNDIEYIVNEALKTIPEKSEFYRCISDVVSWYRKYPDDWKQTWFEVERKWTQDTGCPDGVFSPFNIDAKVNAAYVVIGLLYGKGDFGKTIDIATRCGQDSDCNPSTAGGVLGTMTGYNKIPSHWKTGLKEAEEMNFMYTTISLEKTYEYGFRHSLAMVEKNGGNISGDNVTINIQKPVPVRFEKSFESLYPIEKKSLNRYITSADNDSVIFSFEGTGIVLTGYAQAGNDLGQAAKAEIYLNGSLSETIILPYSFITRKTEVFYKYPLPKQKYSVKVRIISKAENVKIYLGSALVYSDAPVNNTIGAD